MSRIHYHFLCDLFKHALMLSDNIMLELSSGLSRFAQQLMNHGQEVKVQQTRYRPGVAQRVPGS
jgi:hypothetical protein